jgi:hypothetical protein
MIRGAFAAWVLISVIQAGCNAVFDVDRTNLAVEPPERDSDGDGIVNEADNCVLVANDDQGDGDGDELGDACDPCREGDTQTGIDGDGDGVDDGCDSCLNGINHDEDGDGVGDGCDVCPGVPDSAQGDDNGDGVGDACAPDSTLRRRVFFDGFGPPNGAWNTGFKPWEETADGYSPKTPEVGGGTFLEGPWNPSAVVMGAGVRVIASVIVPPPTLEGRAQVTGLSMREVLDGSPTASCTLRVNGLDWVVSGDSSATPVPAGRTRIELAYKPSATVGYASTTCTIAGITVTPMNLFDETSMVVPSLVATVDAEFEWIDVLE